MARASVAGHEAARAAAEVEHEMAHAAELLRTEPFWQAQAVLLGALILYLTLPGKLVVGPKWLMPALELLLVAAVWLDRPRLGRAQARRERTVLLILLGMVAAANLAQLELLVHFCFTAARPAGAP